MLAWLRSLFIGKGSYDLYKPTERRIYNFFNGKGTVRADPVHLWKRMMEKGPEIDINRRVATSKSKDAVKAHGELINNIHWLFSTEPLSAGGLTDEEAVQLLDHFLNYCEESKKNSKLSATSSPNWEDSEASSAGDQPTTNSSASGPTDNGSPTVPPPLSPKESVSPMECSTPV